MDLYALAPEEFTAARDAAAKADKALKSLRKPTKSAWVVNTLVRREPALVDQLVALGADLAAAQRGGDAAGLRELAEQRRQLVSAVTARALELVDRDVSAAARAEVEATLEAALADPPSAEAVRSGNLTRPLAFAGFGGVDLDGAVADVPPRSSSSRVRTSAPPPATEKISGSTGAAGGAAERRQAKAVAALEAKALDAQGALDDAVGKAQRAAAALDQAAADRAAAEAEHHAATEAVESARAALEAAEAAARDAQHRRTQARKAEDDLARRAQRATDQVATAQAAAEQARAALDAARRG